MLTKAKLKIMILKMSKMLIFTMILKMSLKMKQKPILEESTSEEINAANKEESDKDEPPKKVCKNLPEIFMPVDE